MTGIETRFGLRLAIRTLLGLGSSLAAGCSSATVVEPEPIPADYVDWYSVESTGEVPGHGDSVRLIYVNDVGTSYPGIGLYPIGTVIVKEVHERDGDQPGDLDYVAVMRKLLAAPDGGELQGGWLFTYLADGIDSDEENRLSCWDNCHQAAPIDGAFLNYAPPAFAPLSPPSVVQSGLLDVHDEKLAELGGRQAQ